MKNFGLQWGDSLLSFLALGLTGGKKSIHKFTCQCPSPSAFLFRAEFGKVLPWIHLYSGHFSTPTSPPWCSPEGRKGGGGMPVTAASRHSWLWFICKATEEAGEFPEAPSSYMPWYQRLAKVSLPEVPFCFSIVPYGTQTNEKGAPRFGEWRPGWQKMRIEGLRRRKALHSMEVCKRARQCQAVFTQVACSSHCLWSPPPALSEIGSWIRLLKRKV